MWRLAFRTEDERCGGNRAINLMALRLLYERHRSGLLEAAKAEQGYYSDVALTGAPLHALVSFLSYHPAFFAGLTDAARVPLSRLVDADPDQFASASFLATDLGAHLDEVLSTQTCVAFRIQDQDRDLQAAIQPCQE